MSLGHLFPVPLGTYGMAARVHTSLPRVEFQAPIYPALECPALQDIPANVSSTTQVTFAFLTISLKLCLPFKITMALFTNEFEHLMLAIWASLLSHLCIFVYQIFCLFLLVL